MEIEGRSMITHEWERAVSANVGKVLVATDSIEIGEQIHVLGGDVIITEKNHVSGTDRVYEAIEKFDPEKKFQIVVNLQGDLPLIEKDALDKLVLRSSLHHAIGGESGVEHIASAFDNTATLKKYPEIAEEITRNINVWYIIHFK